MGLIITVHSIKNLKGVKKLRKKTFSFSHLLFVIQK